MLYVVGIELISGTVPTYLLLLITIGLVNWIRLSVHVINGGYGRAKVERKLRLNQAGRVNDGKFRFEFRSLPAYSYCSSLLSWVYTVVWSWLAWYGLGVLGWCVIIVMGDVVAVGYSGGQGGKIISWRTIMP